MRRTERAAYRTKFYSNLSSPTQFDEEPLLLDLIEGRTIEQSKIELSTLLILRESINYL
ncbi:TPA: hypothetical protein NY582_001497 [Enterococcus faecium]|nr:hypothetical protein [Enterococcus faecium]HCK3464982.1 hypothetical protein [Enterococcus faecium]